MEKTVEELQIEVQIQKEIAFTAGILQGDITLKTLFESIAESVVVVNKLGRIIMVNNQFEKLFGYAKMELMGEPMEVLLLPEYKNRHGKHLLTFFENPTMRSMGGGFDLAGLSKDQKQIPIEISLSYLNTTAGTLGLAFISDISNRKIAEQKILDKNEALDAFAHTLAHDLKSSLNSIIGFSDLLIDESDIEESKKKQILFSIAKSGRKMNQIIESILFFAKVDKTDVVPEPLDMLPILESVLFRLKKEADEKNANIRIIDNKLMKHALGYSPWIEEVMFNLIGNAIKHGGDSPQIEIGCNNQGEYVQYYVQNNGIPLSKERIEELNHTISEIKTDAISGFGLSIVNRILHKLDGQLKIESSEQKGNIFSFFLPCIKDDENPKS